MLVFKSSFLKRNCALVVLLNCSGKSLVPSLPGTALRISKVEGNRSNAFPVANSNNLRESRYTN